jgi:transglutaminase-like putative cysteine protease
VRLLRTFPITVLAMVLLSMVGVCAAEKSVKLFLVAITLAALSWYVTEGPRGRLLPRWVANLLLLAASVSVFVDLMLPPNDVAGVLGRFCIWLTLIKLYQRRTARDHAQLMALSLMLVIVGCLQTQALLFGIVLAAYAAVGLYALLLYQLYAAHERVVGAHRAAMTDGPPPAPTVGRRIGLHFRLLATAIGGAGLMLSVALFVVFPRSLGRGLVTPYFHMQAASVESGYADEIDLDAGGRINESRRIAFDVRVVDGEGRPVRVDQPLLLRGAVLDRYDRGRWRASTTSHRRVESGSIAPVDLAVTRLDTPVRTLHQQFRVRRASRTVFGLYAPVSIKTDTPHAFAFAPSTGTLRAADSGPLWEYTVVSSPAATLVVREEEPKLGFVRGVRAADARRVEQLALALLEESGMTLPPPSMTVEERWRWNARAARVYQRFLQSDAFRYTLDIGDIVRRGNDPVVEFLHDTRRGHCEFFASGLAALCHASGIDARVVTGYVAVEYDADAQQYLVRDANAHAWVEVPIGAGRFLPIDPTPPDVLPTEGAADRALAERMEWFYQRLEGTWTSRVVQFDGRAQARLMETLDSGWSRRLSEMVRATRDWMAHVNRAFRLGSAGYIWLGIVGLVIVIAVIALFGLVRRYRMLHRALQLRHVPVAESRRLLRQLGFYADMLNVLERAGHGKPRWQPPQAFAAALAERDPDGAALVHRLTETFYEARYAGRRLSGGEIAEAETLVTKLDQTLRGGR